MVGGCQHHARTIGQRNGLQYIDRLRQVSHMHAVAMLVENIEGDPGHQCIAQRVLLIKETRIATGLHVIPSAPFIYDQANLFVRIKAIHDRSMIHDDLVHDRGFFQRGKPFFFIEFGGRAFLGPIVRNGVVVQAEAMHIAGCLAHQHFCPRQVAIV